MPAVDLRVLGRVEVSYQGRQLPLGRRQLRRVLGILILRANQLVSVDRFIQLLWGDEPPRQARAVVQTRVSELRSALAALAADAVRLESRGGGYLLHADPATIDSVRFLALSRQARDTPDPRRATELLHEGLALWRGRVLEAEPGSPIWDAFGMSLESARLTAIEDLLTVTLHTDDPATVADRALGEASANPARDRLVALSLRALHAAGRTAQALQRYDSWRRWLRDTLGVDPSPELAGLHLALVRGDAQLPDDAADRWNSAPARAAPPEPTAAEGQEAPGRPLAYTLPADIADFTGRAVETGVIRALLVDPALDRAPVVAVSGPGGVGKTALALHVAHQLRGRYPDGQLYANLRGVEDDAPAGTGEVLSRFLRALGVDNASLPASFEERVDLYRSLLATRRVLLVLDNVADDEQVAPLIPGVGGCAVIITSRRRLGATLAATTLPLEVLAPAQAVELLGVVAGTGRVAAEAETAAELCRLCGLLPLAIRVAGAKLAGKPHWGIAKLVGLLADERGRLDQFSHGHLDVRASIGLSYGELSADARTLLRRLADLNLPEYPVWLAAAVLDTDLSPAEALCEELFDAQLLDIAGTEVTGHARYRMHDLVRLYARTQAHDDPEELEASAQRASGALLFLAETLQRRCDAGVWIEVATQPPARPVPAPITQALTAAPVRWFDQEYPLISVLIRRSAQTPQSGLCWQLVVTLSTAYQMRREFDDWHELLSMALHAARAVGDERAEALVRHVHGMALLDTAETEAGQLEFDAAYRYFTTAGDRAASGVVLNCLGLASRHRGDNAQARQCFESALPLLEAAGRWASAGFALRSLGQIAMQEGDMTAADLFLERALRRFRECDSEQGEATALHYLGQLRLRQDRVSEAELLARATLALAESLDDRPGIAMSHYGIGLCLLRRGEREAGRAQLRQALHLLHGRGPGPLIPMIAAALADS